MPTPPFSLSTLLSPTPSPSLVAAAVREATLPIEHRIGEIRRSAVWYLERCSTDEGDRAVLRGMEAATVFGPWFPYDVVDRLARASQITPVRAAQLRYLGSAIAAVVEPQLLPNGKVPPLAEPEVRAACAEIGLDPGRLVGALSTLPDRDPIALVAGSVWIALGGAGAEAHESAPEAAEYQVFVSHDSQDKEQASKIAAALGAKGMRTFLASRDLKSGDPWAEAIRQALLSSQELCVLCSPDSVKSEWVTTEWGAGWALGKTVVPILHRVDLGQLPVRLRLIQALDLDKLADYVTHVAARKAEWEAKRSK
jgi:hypothetical protein